MKRISTCVEQPVETPSTDNEFPFAIELKKKYKLSIRPNNCPLVSLHYSFKPENVDTMKDGLLQMDLDSGEAKSILYRKDEKMPVEFNGNLMQSLSASTSKMNRLTKVSDSNSDNKLSNNHSANHNHHFMLEFDAISQEFILRPFNNSILNLRQSSDTVASSSGPSYYGEQDILKRYMKRIKPNAQKKTNGKIDTKILKES